MAHVRLLQNITCGDAGDIFKVINETDESLCFFDTDSHYFVLAKSEEGKLFEYVAYILITDDDGHWYLIEKSQRKMFNAWVEAVSEGDEVEFDFDHCMLPGYPANFIEILEYRRK